MFHCMPVPLWGYTSEIFKAGNETQRIWHQSEFLPTSYIRMAERKENVNVFTIRMMSVAIYSVCLCVPHPYSVGLQNWDYYFFWSLVPSYSRTCRKKSQLLKISASFPSLSLHIHLQAMQILNLCCISSTKGMLLSEQKGERLTNIRKVIDEIIKLVCL